MSDEETRALERAGDARAQREKLRRGLPVPIRVRASGALMFGGDAFSRGTGTFDEHVEAVRALPGVFKIRRNGVWEELALRPKGNGGWWEVKVRDPDKPILNLYGFYASEILIGEDL